MKIKNELKKISIALIPSLFFMLSILILELVFRYHLSKILPGFYTIKRSSVFFSASIISIFGLIYYILDSKIRKLFVTILITFNVILILMNDIYFSIFKDFLSIRQISTIGEGSVYFNIIFERINTFHISLVSIGLILIILNIILINKLKSFKTNKFFSVAFILISLFSHFYGISIIGILDDSSTWELFDNNRYIYENLTNTKKAMHQAGTLEYTRKDLELYFKRVIKSFNSADIEVIDEYLQSNSNEILTNSSTSLFKGKNLIFILAESLDEFAINELTPTLLKMKNEGIYFDNFYIPAYPRTTCDTEFIMQTGLFPSLDYGPTCYEFNQNEYPYSLARLFKDKGYTSNSFHNNIDDFYSRNILHETLGFEEFYDVKDLGISAKKDTQLYYKGKDFISPIQEQPFYSFVITISGHGGYYLGESLLAQYMSQSIEYFDGYDEQIIAYAAYNQELDKFLELTINDLESKNLMDDTVLIVMSDHYPYMMDEEIYQDMKETQDVWQYARLPLIIYSTDIDPTVISELGSSLDIMPTIVDLFDLDVNSKNLFGNSMFSEKNTPVIYKDYSVFDGVNYYTNNDVKFNSLYERIDIFQRILVNDYFRNTKSTE